MSDHPEQIQSAVEFVGDFHERQGGDPFFRPGSLCLLALYSLTVILAIGQGAQIHRMLFVELFLEVLDFGTFIPGSSGSGFYLSFWSLGVNSASITPSVPVARPSPGRE